MIRVPVITDQHFGARGDSEVVYRVQEQFYTQVFWPAIDAQGNVKEILNLGDVTDRRKFVNFRTLEFAKKMFFEPAAQRGIRVHWLLGNHDLPYKHSLQLSSHEAFKEYGNVYVYQDAQPVIFGGMDTLLMPWLCEENMQTSMNTLAQFTGSTVAGHFEFGGFDVLRGVTNHHGLSIDPFKSFPLVMSGHYHHRSSRDNIHYLGSPYELTWGDYGDARGFHWWTPQTHTLEFVANPHHLFYKFVYDDTNQSPSYVKDLLTTMGGYDLTQKIVKIVVRQKTQPLWYDAFADAVLKMGAYDVQFVDDTVSMQTAATDVSDASLDTLSTIHWYVQSVPWANSQVQQDVTDLMSSLYQEATEHAKTVARY